MRNVKRLHQFSESNRRQIFTLLLLPFLWIKQTEHNSVDPVHPIGKLTDLLHWSPTKLQLTLHCFTFSFTLEGWHCYVFFTLLTTYHPMQSIDFFHSQKKGQQTRFALIESAGGSSARVQLLPCLDYQSTCYQAIEASNGPCFFVGSPKWPSHLCKMTLDNTTGAWMPTIML